MQHSQHLGLWAEALRSIANDELYYASGSPYTTDRMRRLLRIAAEIHAAQDTRDADQIDRIFQGDLTRLSPRLGGDGAIFDEEGRILLIQRSDDELWAMPGGALEVGETPAEGACREVWEETRVRVEPVALVGVYDSRRCGSGLRSHLYHFVFSCRPCDAMPRPLISNETLDVRWFHEGELPRLSPGHPIRIADAFRHWRGDVVGAVFDPIPS